MTTDPRRSDNDDAPAGLRELQWARQREQWGPKVAGDRPETTGRWTVAQLKTDGFLTDDMVLTAWGRGYLTMLEDSKGIFISGNGAGIPVHPVRVRTRSTTKTFSAIAPQLVTMRAFEVFCEIADQDDGEEGPCSNEYAKGFSAGQLVALLYARSFPKKEWRNRFLVAQNGLGLD